MARTRHSEGGPHPQGGKCCDAVAVAGTGRSSHLGDAPA
jgi:hypothetical protein